MAAVGATPHRPPPPHSPVKRRAGQCVLPLGLWAPGAHRPQAALHRRRSRRAGPPEGDVGPGHMPVYLLGRANQRPHTPRAPPPPKAGLGRSPPQHEAPPPSSARRWDTEAVAAPHASQRPPCPPPPPKAHRRTAGTAPAAERRGFGRDCPDGVPYRKRGGGILRVGGGGDLQILARQSLYHFLKVSEQMMDGSQ